MLITISGNHRVSNRFNNENRHSDEYCITLLRWKMERLIQKNFESESLNNRIPNKISFRESFSGTFI